MNKKGQTLILFVILIPILITCLAFVVDVGILTNEYQKTRGIIEDGIRDYFDSNQSIKELLILNDIPVEELVIHEESDKVSVDIHYQINSLFGTIINIKNYEIELHLVGKKQEDKVIISKEE